MTGPCTCFKGYPVRGERHVTYTDDQCPTHGYEEWLGSRVSPVGALTIITDEEWLSTCCGAPPSRATPDVGEDNPAGICGQCREHTGFERSNE